MTLAGLSPAGALIVRAGEPKTLHVFLKDREGNVQDLAGRTLSLVIRRTADRHPLFTIGAELSGDARYFVVSIPAQTASGITDAGLRQSLSHDLVETTGGGSVTRWTERVAVVEGPEMPDLPPVSVDLPFSQAVISPHAIVVSERGATGQSAAIQLYLAGHIDAPTVEAMEAWLSSISEDAANAVLADLVARLERLENLGVGDVADLAEAVAQLTQQVSDNNDGSAAADQALGDRIDQSDDARIAGDAALGQRIDATEGAMAAADEALGQRIDQSDAARMAADEALGARVDLADQHLAAEVERATAVDQAHSDRLAALDAIGLATTKGAGTALMGSSNIAESGNGARVPAWRGITPTDLLSRKAPTDYRYLFDALKDAGEAIENFISPKATATGGGPLDHYAAFNRGVTDKSCSRLLLNRPSYYFRSGIGSKLRNMVFVSGSVAGGRPTIIFSDELHHMIDLGTDCENIRFEGHWIVAFRDTPASSSIYGLSCSGCKNVEFDRLTILNSLGGARFAGTTANVYIRQLDLPAGAPFATANTISNVVIGRLTGGDTSTIGAGHDLKIGVQLPAILASIGLLTAAANKHIRFNGSALPVLDDWIEQASWTPTVSCGSPGDLNTSGLTTSGSYWKYGRQLILDYVITGSITYSTATGNLQIGGVPFLFSGTTSQPMDAPNTLPAAWTWPGTSPTVFYATAVGSQNYFNFAANKSGSSYSLAQIGMWASGAASITLRGRIRAMANQ